MIEGFTIFERLNKWREEGCTIGEYFFKDPYNKRNLNNHKPAKSLQLTV